LAIILGKTGRMETREASEKTFGENEGQSPIPSHTTSESIKDGRRTLLSLKNESEKAPNDPEDFLQVLSAGGPILQQVALETIQGVIWVAAPQGRLPRSFLKQAIRIRAPGHHWAELDQARGGQILLDPINLFRLEGPEVARKIEGAQFSSTEIRFPGRELAMSAGPTEDANWAAALDGSPFETGRADHYWNFEITLRNHWILSVELKSDGRKVLIPFDNILIPEEKPVKILLLVKDPQGKPAGSGIRVNLMGAMPKVGSKPHPWGNLFVLPRQWKEEKRTFDSKVEAVFPFGATCSASVLDGEKHWWGGIGFSNDGRLKVLQLHSTQHFSGKIATVGRAELPEKIRIEFHRRDDGWVPGEVKNLTVSRNGKFVFFDHPMGFVNARKKPEWKTLGMEIQAKGFHDEEVDIINGGQPEIGVGTIVLTPKDPSLFVDTDGARKPGDYLWEPIYAKSKDLENGGLIISHAKKMADGSLALFASDEENIHKIPDEVDLIVIASGPDHEDEVYIREDSAHFRLVRPKKEYVVHIALTRALLPQEHLAIGWTWTRSGPLAWTEYLDWEDLSKLEWTARYSAPEKDVYLHLSLLDSKRPSSKMEKWVPFGASDRIVVSFP